MKIQHTFYVSLNIYNDIKFLRIKTEILIYTNQSGG